jgi:hypothetical protein
MYSVDVPHDLLDINFTNTNSKSDMGSKNAAHLAGSDAGSLPLFGGQRAIGGRLLGKVVADATLTRGLVRRRHLMWL